MGPALLLGAALLLAVLALFTCFWANDAVDSLLSRLQGAVAYNLSNVFLQGAFEPVDEERAHVPLCVERGRLPDDLRGLYLHVGPNPIKGQVLARMYHLFDGHGMVHAARLRPGGECAYSNRWVRTPRYECDRAHGRAVFPCIGEIVGPLGLIKACVSFVRKPSLLGFPRFARGTANTAVRLWAGRALALHEESLPFELRLREDGGFEEVGYVDFGGQLDHNMSAHPTADPSTGHLVFHGYHADPRVPAIKWGELAPPAKDTTRGAEPTLRSYQTAPPFPRSRWLWGVPFAHDFAATSHWALLLCPSILINPLFIVSRGIFGFEPRAHAYIGLCPRGGHRGGSSGGSGGRSGAEGGGGRGEARWVSLGGAYAFTHALNAWEGDGASAGREGLVYVWLPMSAVWSPSLADSVLHMAEVTVDTRSGEAAVRFVEEGVSEADRVNLEFPKLHPAFEGRHARFGFVPMVCPQGMSGISKWEMAPGGGGLWSTTAFGPDRYGHEPVPAPKAGPEASDRVWLLVWTGAGGQRARELSVFDGECARGEAMQEVTRLSMDAAGVPFSLHGLWVPEEDLLAHVRAWQAGEGAPVEFGRAGTDGQARAEGLVAQALGFLRRRRGAHSRSTGANGS